MASPRFAAAAVIVLCLSGCKTAEEQAATVEARYASFTGMTMAEFSRTTGVVPSTAYPIDGGKAFVAEWSVGSIVVPGSYGAPTVSRTFSCRLIIETEPVGAGGTADSWRIRSITRQGGCDNV